MINKSILIVQILRWLKCGGRRETKREINKNKSNKHNKNKKRYAIQKTAPDIIIAIFICCMYLYMCMDVCILHVHVCVCVWECLCDDFVFKTDFRHIFERHLCVKDCTCTAWSTPYRSVQLYSIQMIFIHRVRFHSAFFPVSVKVG